MEHQGNACFLPADILLPEPSVPLGQWACVACDQFTSDPDYWARARACAAGGPSALDLILPEAFLDAPDRDGRIEAIHRAMAQYADSVLTRQVHGFVYVERTERSGRVRQGLVGAIDLEAYSYESGALPVVRPSESTVVSRIPPRLAVRRGAVLETPHVMMLADDPEGWLVEAVAAQKAALRPLYEGELMLGGGHIAGWAVESPALIAQIGAAVARLGAQETFDARYPAAAGYPPLTLAVGDGNHSLATAKACWEELRQTLTPAQQKTHPARYCLAEVCNVQSPAIEIEPIHRAFFGTNPESLLLALTAYSDTHGLGLRVGTAGPQTVRLLTAHGEYPLSFTTPEAPLAVGTVEAFAQFYLADHPEASVDYIHGGDALRALAQKGAACLALPAFEKSDVFRGVVLGGVLPRKSFSMGHAEEKRYYLECRRIAE
jgi:hypothetical protein